MTTLSLSQLETHLWRAADILRGSIDSGDYKHYIFGLLFFKRLSDVWQEEYEERLARYNDADLAADPDEHRFDIPKGHFWTDVRKHTTDIGTHLNRAFHSIEDANMRLRGVFQDVDFNNKERFPDAMLEKLLQHFETRRTICRRPMSPHSPRPMRISPTPSDWRGWCRRTRSRPTSSTSASAAMCISAMRRRRSMSPKR